MVERETNDAARFAKIKFPMDAGEARPFECSVQHARLARGDLAKDEAIEGHQSLAASELLAYPSNSRADHGSVGRDEREARPLE